MRTSLLFSVLLAIAQLVGMARAQQSSEPSFDEAIRPLLAARCVECHSAKKRSGKLNLETAVGLVRGGENGDVVVGGHPEKSRLWQRVADEEMPPEEPLASQEREILRRWIESGAHGLPPREQAGKAGDGRDHWAFRSPCRPAIPPVRVQARLRGDIDRFIAAKLEERGLSLSAEADRTTLIRRVSFDLTGLPPSPAEIATFLADDSDAAYEQMVEHYLASPQYGERWGRYWLDAVGYADSNGYFSADTDRPLAYRYRDYVIRAFNEDKPFDRFVTEQLAGDELAGFRPDCDITPDVVDLYTATHFLRNAPDGTDSSDGNADELLLDRFTVIEGTVQIIGSSLLGLTLQCARCHDHKFEPVRQKEYYQLQAILFPGYCPDQWVKAAARTVTLGTRQEREAHARRTAELTAHIETLRESLAAAANPLKKQIVAERLTKLEETERAAVAAAVEKSEAERTAEQKQLLEKHKELISVDDAKIAERFSEYGQFAKSVNERIGALEREKPAPLEKIAVFAEVTEQPPPHHVLIRGGYRQWGEEVGPGVPEVLCEASDEQNDRQYFLPPKAEGQYSSGRRLALARWLTAANHPLFARVAVNRLWQQHFGTGIVATSDNFGYTGAEPTHPELLDYLATEFSRCGWSVKEIHRRIMRSAVYRQSSAPIAAALEIDPKNRLLWRYPMRRLDAEAIRDAMLSASGEIDRAISGPYVPTVRQPDGGVVVKSDQPGNLRRSIYLQQRRSQMPSMLEVFDAPSMAATCPRRNTSTVALQSLSLLNGEFTLARAEALAKRVLAEAAPALDDRLSRAFLLTLGRAPRMEERQIATEFFRTQAAVYDGKDHREQLVWRDLAQLLFASSAFLYVE